MGVPLLLRKTLKFGKFSVYDDQTIIVILLDFFLLPKLSHRALVF